MGDHDQGPRPGRRRTSRRRAPAGGRWLGRAALSLCAAALGAYALVWAVPALRTTAAETVITSGHSGLARLVTTPAEYRRLLRQWLDTPNLTVVTDVAPPARSASGSDPVVSADPSVSVHPVQGPDWRGWVLLVQHPSWVHVAVTPDIGRVGEQVSTFGSTTAGAIAAVNGGGFEDAMGDGTGGLPVGVTASFGAFSDYPDLTGDYVIGLDSRGRLDVGKWTMAQAEALGIREAVSFKPLLVVNGQPQITSGDGGWGIGPRTAIGQRADGTIVFAVIDGRQPSSLGATLLQVQNLMLAEGAVTAVNLDGGSSSTLWYRGQVMNNPCCSPNGQRYIATAFVVVPPAGSGG